MKRYHSECEKSERINKKICQIKIHCLRKTLPRVKSKVNLKLVEFSVESTCF